MQDTTETIDILKFFILNTMRHINVICVSRVSVGSKITWVGVNDTVCLFWYKLLPSVDLHLSSVLCFFSTMIKEQTKNTIPLEDRVP